MDVRVPDLTFTTYDDRGYERDVRFSAGSPGYLSIQVDEDVHAGMVTLARTQAHALRLHLNAGEVMRLGERAPGQGKAALTVGPSTFALPLPGGPDDPDYRVEIPRERHREIANWLGAVLTGEHDYTGADGEVWEG